MPTGHGRLGGTTRLPGLQVAWGHLAPCSEYTNQEGPGPKAAAPSEGVRASQTLSPGPFPAPSLYPPPCPSVPRPWPRSPTSAHSLFCPRFQLLVISPIPALFLTPYLFSLSLSVSASLSLLIPLSFFSLCVCVSRSLWLCLCASLSLSVSLMCVGVCACSCVYWVCLPLTQCCSIVENALVRLLPHLLLTTTVKKQGEKAEAQRAQEAV